jgi:hypothetical protein
MEQTRSSPDLERLEGWKAIADYLGKTVSTVQRWEASLGLPIHRLNKAHRATPYAITSELDAWREARRHSHETPTDTVDEPPAAAESPENSDHGDLVPSRARFRHSQVALIATTTLLAAAVGLGFFSSSSVVKPTPPSVEGSTAVTIVSDNPGLVFGPISLDGSAAYVTVKEVGQPGGGSHVAIVALESGHAKMLYRSSAARSNITSVAVLGDYLYWGDSESGPLTDSEIWRAPKDGRGIAEVVYRGAERGQGLVDVWSLVSDGTRLYVADAFQGRVLTFEPRLGSVEQIGPMRYGGGFEGARANALALLGDTLFVAQSAAKTSRLPVEGPLLPRIQCHAVTERVSPWAECLKGLALAGGDPLSIATGDGTVFVAQGGTIYSTPATGGPVARLTDPIFHAIAGLAYRDRALYVSDNMGADGVRPAQLWARVLRVDLR